MSMAHKNSWVPCCGPAVPVASCSVDDAVLKVLDALGVEV